MSMACSILFKICEGPGPTQFLTGVTILAVCVLKEEFAVPLALKNCT